MFGRYEIYQNLNGIHLEDSLYLLRDIKNEELLVQAFKDLYFNAKVYQIYISEI